MKSNSILPISNSSLVGGEECHKSLKVLSVYHDIKRAYLTYVFTCLEEHEMQRIDGQMSHIFIMNPQSFNEAMSFRQCPSTPEHPI